MNDELESLSAVVQQNCHISDAKFAGNYTLCIYLLKMREYYRWEKGLPFTAQLSNPDVGDWLARREVLWEELDGHAYEPIQLDGQQFDPFDTVEINEALRPKGLVYSGGLGTNIQPHFFLGRLQRRERHNEYTLLVSAQELARDLTAPPAMALHKTIFVRREPLRRMIWEKLEEWNWRGQEGPMSRAFEHYNFDGDLDTALEAITDNEVDSVILHEIGEIKAGELLGDEWHEMLAALPRSQAEIIARAVRDHLADCLSTLPALLERATHTSLHFYFGNLHAMRKELFPGLHQAYQQWLKHDRLKTLEEIVQRGARHWEEVAHQMLRLFREHGAQCVPHIENLAQHNRL